MSSAVFMRGGDTIPTSDAHLKFRELLDVFPAAAYTCDADGLITYYNNRAVQLWGRKPKLNDPVDRYCGSFKLFTAAGSPINHDRCWMALALSKGDQYNGQEIIIERPDGSRRIVLAHANPFHDQAGKLTGAVNVLVDITDRKQAEEEAREAGSRKTEFLATLAHELRNPLAPLRNSLQIIRVARHDPAMLDEACKVMERQLGHMVRLIDDLLDVSRMTRGRIVLRKKRIDVGSVVRDAVETSRPLIEASGNDFTVTMPQEPAYVEADRTRLAQVITNLLNNSAKYTESGGQIWLTVQPDGNQVAIKVKDTGIGFPAELLPQLFDMFSHGDGPPGRLQEGLGIGLTLVRGLVQMHGGTVEASSAGPGRGSEFIVRLPTISSLFDNEGNGAKVDQNANGSSGTRILVVDDNKDSALSLAMMLTIMGHQTNTAFDGMEAIEKAGQFRPDVVLLDIGLPKVGGYEACRRIRQQPGGESMVLIALTGWGQEEDKRRAKEAGFNFHLVKPVDPAAIQRILAGPLRAPA